MIRRDSLPFAIGLGAMVGSVWSVVPIVFLRAADRQWPFVAAGAATGLLLTVLLAKVPLPRWAYWFVGVLTLPAGAFLFGCFLALLATLFGTEIMPDAPGPQEPALHIGATFAMLSLVPPFVLLTLPSAVATTFFVVRMCRSKQSESAVAER